MQAELNDLSSDIELKTKLIEQLELSQNRLKIMKQHYEEKLNVLNSKIVNTQQERDQVLANLEAGNKNLFSSCDFSIINFLLKALGEYRIHCTTNRTKSKKYATSMNEKYRICRRNCASYNQRRKNIPDNNGNYNRKKLNCVI